MPLTFNKPLVLGKKAVFDADAFTVIGSPVISADGIASGFSSGDYIKIPDFHFENSNNWTVQGSFKYTGNINSEGGGLLSVTSGNGFLIGVDRSANNLLKFGVFLSSVPNEWNIYNASNDDILEFTQNADYNFTVSFDGTKYYIYCINKATGAKFEKTIVTNAVIYQTPTQLGLKRTSSTGRFQGSIDLNAFKIYIDGAEVLSGSKLITPEWQNKPFKFDVNTIN